MTTKEIAKAVGKTERGVRNWVSKLAEKNAVIAEKLSSSSPMKPADYTLDETIEIIRQGMGDSAAGVFQANAQQPQKTQITTESLRQARLAVKGQIISVEEARKFLGLEHSEQKEPVADNLGRISKQAYAVEMKVRQEARQKLIADIRQEKLNFY